MKLRFAFFTWLIAILLNAILTAIYLSSDSMLFELAEWWGLFLTTLGITLLFSFPGFAGIFLWIWIADNFYFSPIQKFLCFSFGCLLSTFLCYGLLSFIFGVSLAETKIYYLILMSLLSVAAALLLQRKYFYKIVTPSFD